MRPTPPSTTRRLATLLMLVLSIVAHGGWAATPAHAAALVVNTSADELNTDGDCSLREAIEAANTDAAVDACAAGAGADTITFAAALTAGGSATITLTIFDSGLDPTEFGPTAFDILGDITITGPTGANGVTITRGGASNFRLFRVVTGASLTLQNLTLSNGRAQGGGGGVTSGGSGGGGGAGMGGAIFNRGTLTIVASTFSGNQAIGGPGAFGGAGGMGNGGGGVGADGIPGDITIGGVIGGTIDPNAGNGGGPNGGLAGQVGGPISQPGGEGGGGGGSPLPVLGPGGNGGFGGGGGGAQGPYTAGNGGFGGGAGAVRDGGGTGGTPGFGGGGPYGHTGGGGAGMGGAIFNRGGTVTITNSTFSGNTAEGGTGGFGTTNPGSGLGGAIFNLDGTLNVSFSTLSGNTVANGPPASGTPAGGAIFSRQETGGVTVTLNGTILANSIGGSDAVISGGGTATGSQSNIIETNAAAPEDVPAGLIIAANGDPQLGALAVNGGPTRTHLPGATSPALNAVPSGTGGCGTTVTTDQRSTARPVGAGCEIGAVEFAPPSLGSYGNASVDLSRNITVAPSAAPSSMTRITAIAPPAFRGNLTVDVTTGVVRVTNAAPPGSYAIKVTGFDSGGSATVSTFTLTVSNPAVCAYGAFHNPVTVNGLATGITHGATGDFNGDGNQDIALLSEASARVNVYLGNGLGGFTPSALLVLTGGSAPKGITVADFNGDGREDIITANSAFNSASLFPGNGDGTFGAVSIFSAGLAPFGVAAGDFNGDGRLDVAFPNNGNSRVSLRMGNSAGGFTAGTDIFLSSNPAAIAAGDFNGDGKTDLATVHPSFNNVAFMSGNGTGGFTVNSIVAVGTGPNAIGVADFDGDGKQDVATSNATTGNVSLLRNVTTNPSLISFAAAVNTVVAPTAPSPYGVSVGDFNRDGRPDIATVSNSNGQIVLLLNNGAGGFVMAPSYPSGGPLGYPPIVGDFNGDGKQDLATPNNSTNQFLAISGQCAPTISTIAAQTMDQDTTLGPLNFTVGDTETTPGSLTVTAFSSNPAIVPTANIALGGSGATRTVTVTPAAGASGSLVITLQVSDGIATASSTFVLTINSLNTAPTAIGLTPSTVNENQPIGTLVGTLSATDPDGGPTYTYSLVTGPGDTGNANFTISGNQLRTAAVFDYEAQASYSIRVQVNDGKGGIFATPLSVTIGNVTGAPTITSAAPAAGQYRQSYSHSFAASGDPAATFAVTVGTLPPGLTLTAAGLLSGTPTQAGSFGPITVRASNGINPVATQTFTLVIGKAPLTVTANAQSRPYGAANPALTYGATGLLGPDTAATALTGALTTTANATSAVGAYPITVGTLAAANYTITFVGASLSVTPATLTVTAAAKTRVYGAANPALTYTATGFVNGQTAAIITGALATTANATSPVGAYPIGLGTLSAPNYSISFIGASLTVTAATLNVVADAKARLIGDPNPPLTYTATGFVNGQTAAIITGALATTATPASPAGTYPITIGTLSAPNYTITFTGANLTVATAVLNVTANPQTRAYGAANPPLTYSVTGFVGGDTAAIMTGALATAATATSNVGAYAITQGTLAAPNYLINYTGASLSVTPAALTATADNKTRAFGAANPPLTISYTGFKNGDTAAVLDTPPTATTTATLSSPPGAYTISVGGGADLNYTFTYVDGTLTVIPGQIPCTASALLSLLSGPGPVINLDGSCRYQLTALTGTNGHLVNLYNKANLTINGNGATIERAAGAGQLGLLALINSSNVTIRDLNLVGGRANGPITELSGRGGGMMLYNSTGVSLVNVRFLNNSATAGGALSTFGGSTSVVNGVFANNQAGAAGAAIYAQGATTVVNSTMTSASASPREAIFTWDALSLQNSIVANHAVGLVAAGSGKTVAEDYNVYSDVGLARKTYNVGTRISAGANSFVTTGVAQRFVDPAGHDYRLTAGSPALDRGTALGGALDAGGNPRPAGGSRVDLGAYEFQTDTSLYIRRIAPRWAAAGAPFEVTVVVVNRGLATLSNVAVHDSVPGGARVSGPISDGGAFDGQAVRWTLASLAPGASRALTYALSASQTVIGDDYAAVAPGAGAPRATGPAVTTAINPSIVRRLTSATGAPFDPAAHGFSFAAWGGAPTGQELSAASMYALLGPEVCTPLTRATAGGCVLTATAERQRQELELTLAEGRTFGAAATSLRLFLGLPLPGGAVKPADLQPGATVTADLLRYPGLQQAIAVYQAGRQWAPLSDAAGAQVTNGSPSAVVSFLLDQGFDGPQNNGAYTLSITRRDGSGGRALVPYALEQRAGGAYGLYVYDAGAPGDGARVIVLDPAANTWVYTSGGAAVAGYEGDAQSGSIALRSLSHDTSLPRSCGFCGGGDGIIFELRGGGRVLVTDSAGRRAGHDLATGAPLSEIPGATISRPWSEAATIRPTVVTVPAGDSYSLRLGSSTAGGAGIRLAAGAEILDLRISGPGVTGGLSGLSLSGAQTAGLSFDAGGKAIAFTSGDATQAPTLQLAVERADGSSYSFAISSFQLPSSRSVTMAYSETADTLRLEDDDAGKAQRYDLTLVRVKPDGASHTFQRNNVTGGAGAGAIFQLAGWNGTSAPRTQLVMYRLFLPVAVH